MPKKSSNDCTQNPAKRYVLESLPKLDPLLKSSFYSVRYALSIYLFLQNRLDYLETGFIHKSACTQFIAFLNKIMQKITEELFTHASEYTRHEKTIQSIVKGWEEKIPTENREPLRKLPGFSTLEAIVEERKLWKKLTHSSNSAQNNPSLLTLDLQAQRSNPMLASPKTPKALDALLKHCTQLKDTYKTLAITEHAVCKLLILDKSLTAFLDMVLIDYSNQLIHQKFKPESFLGFLEKSRKRLTGLINKLDRTPLHTLAEHLPKAPNSILLKTHFYPILSILTQLKHLDRGNAEAALWCQRMEALTHKASQSDRKTVLDSVQRISQEYALKHSYLSFLKIASKTPSYPARIYRSLDMIVRCAGLPKENYAIFSPPSWQAWFQEFNHRPQDDTQIKDLLEKWKTAQAQYAASLSGPSYQAIDTALNHAFSEHENYTALVSLTHQQQSYQRRQITLFQTAAVRSASDRLPPADSLLGFQLINLCLQLAQAYQSLKPHISPESKKSVGKELFEGINLAFQQLQKQLFDQLVQQLGQAKNHYNHNPDFCLRDYIRTFFKDYDNLIQAIDHPDWKRYQPIFNTINTVIQHGVANKSLAGMLDQLFDPSDLALSPSPPTTPITPQQGQNSYLISPPSTGNSSSQRRFLHG